MLKRLLICLVVIATAMFAAQVVAADYEDVNSVKEANATAASTLNNNITLRGPVLYDNGPLVTNPGAGAGGADVSLLSNTTLGETTLGYGHQVSDDNRVADDFTVTGLGWNIDSIRFYAYQSFAGSDTITAVNLRIWDGDPSDAASNVVFGDTTTNRLDTTGFANIYRLSETASGGFDNTDRAVQANDVAVGTTLGPGTYWLDWQSDGSAASGPWAPPISFLDQTNAPGANALQSVDPGVWQAAARRWIGHAG